MTRGVMMNLCTRSEPGSDQLHGVDNKLLLDVGNALGAGPKPPQKPTTNLKEDIA